MHGTVRKICYNTYDLIVDSGIVPDFTHRGTHHFADGLTKRLYTSFVYDHGVAIVQVPNLTITTCNQLQVEGCCKIKFYVQLIPLQFFISDVSKLDFCSYVSKIIEHAYLIGHGYVLNLRIVQ